MNQTKVVVTGLGVIAPNGVGKEEYWKSIIAGESGICKISRFDPAEYPSKVAGEVNNFHPTDYIEPKLARRLSRFAQFALAATRMALDDASLKLGNGNCAEELSYRTGISFATSIGGQELNEQQYDVFREKGVNAINPLCVSVINNNTALGIIASEFKIKGPNMTICTGCSSALNAIAYGYDLIQSNRADIVIAGGSETPITPFAFDTFCSAHVLAKGNGNPKTASRPFEKLREGYILSEGAGVVIMESMNFALKRQAKIYAEVAGYGVTNDGFNIFKMEPTGKEVVKAIKIALENAGLVPEDIDYINAHGSSSQVSDKRETMAIKEVFNGSAYKTPVSSIKSMIGQPLASTGAIQAVTTMLAMKNKRLPPTINYEYPDPDCDLDYVPNTSREDEVEAALVNSFGLGGNNISMVLKNYNSAKSKQFSLNFF